MKKLAAALLLAALPLTACKEPSRAPRTHEVRKMVYHLPDGRYAYQQDDTWYYMTMLNAQRQQDFIYAPPTASARVYMSSATPSGWAKGPAPTDREIAEATPSAAQIGIPVEQDGQPLTAEEAVEAVEATVSEATGEAQGSSEAAGGGGTVEAASSDTGSSDSGSSDSGGGGDIGGGGGE